MFDLKMLIAKFNVDYCTIKRIWSPWNEKDIYYLFGGIGWVSWKVTYFIVISFSDLISIC